jgi:hypothetical protein
MAANTKDTPTADDAANAAEAAEEKKRTRKPSEFKQRGRVNLFFHANTSVPNMEDLANSIATSLLSGDDADAPNALRVTARSRAGSKSTVANVSIYVAPNGHVYPDADEAGTVRINAETWAALKPQLEAMGLPATPEGIAQLVAALSNATPNAEAPSN